MKKENGTSKAETKEEIDMFTSQKKPTRLTQNTSSKALYCRALAATAANIMADLV